MRLQRRLANTTGNDWLHCPIGRRLQWNVRHTGPWMDLPSVFDYCSTTVLLCWRFSFQLQLPFSLRNLFRYRFHVTRWILNCLQYCIRAHIIVSWVFACSVLHCHLARSAKLPTKLYILLALISFFCLYIFFFTDLLVSNYCRICWTNFHNLFTKWKRFGWRWSIWTSFSDISRDIVMATNFVKRQTPKIFGELWPTFSGSTNFWLRISQAFFNR